MDCSGCGTCCVAPDISAMGKKLWEKCRHLTEARRCGIYEERPAVCRGYRPDEICLKVAAPTLEERVEKYLRLFGLERD